MIIARSLVVMVLSGLIAVGATWLVRAGVVSAGQTPAPIVKPYDPYP